MKRLLIVKVLVLCILAAGASVVLNRTIPSTWAEVPALQLTANVEWDGVPSISGDGSKVAWAQGPRPSEIYVMNSDGTGVVEIHVGVAVGNCYFPSIDFLGSKVAFACAVGNDFEVFVVNSDGSGLVQLTNNDAVDYWPTISGDGSKVVFQSNVDGDSEIYVANSDGSGVRQVTFNTFEDNVPAISGDGSKVVYFADPEVFADSEIFVINPDGSGLTQLTSNTVQDRYPAISYDGSRVAFESFVASQTEIFAVNADGSGLTRLTFSSAQDTLPSISGDGSRVFFTRGTTPSQVIVANSDGSGSASLAFGGVRDLLGGASQVSRDGTSVVYTAGSDTSTEVFLATVWPASFFRADWADVDNNGGIDINDVASGALVFDQANAYWDLDRNGVVDINDIAALALVFDTRFATKAYPGSEWPSGTVDPAWKTICGLLPQPDRNYCIALV